MFKSFNPRNWYWIVASSTSQVYSSAAGNYVPVENAAYQEWLARGSKPSKIATEATLGEVLSSYGLKPMPAGVLDGYTDAQAIKLPADLVLKVLFSHENRIRTLAGQPTVTAAQFKSFLRGLV